MLLVHAKHLHSKMCQSNKLTFKCNTLHKGQLIFFFFLKGKKITKLDIVNTVHFPKIKPLLDNLIFPRKTTRALLTATVYIQFTANVVLA